jgi:FtsP/CotA-like multicopper oxidase with cupredoxin domain
MAGKRISRVNRRDFFKYGSLAAAGAYVGLKADVAGAMGGGMGGGGCGCGGGGSSVIDPPLGGVFKDPVELALTRLNGVATGDITPQIRKLPINGTLTDLMTYNGTFPGPLVRLKRGEKWAMRFTNGLPADASRNILGFGRGVTNIHTHGWHVAPSGQMDDVMRKYQPGQYGDYLYDTSLQPGGTLCWYHPHIHGLTAEQVWGGLHGPLVVEDETDAPLNGYETHVMILKDITVSGGKPAAYSSSMEYMQGKEGGTMMVNGQVNPVLSMKPGQVQRWRFLNASTARFYKLSLASHTLQVVGTDGGLLDKCYPQSSMLLAPGERLDVLVKASTTAGSYKLLSLPYSRMGMMSSAQITLLTVSVSGTKVSDALPAKVNAMAMREMPMGTPVARSFALSMSMSRGYINGKDFDVDPLVVNSDVMPGMPMYEVWTVTNSSNMDHPWHQHVNAAQVLSVSGGDAAYAALLTGSPAWKDVVIVPKGGSVKLLVKVADYTGMCMFHCHILEHEDIGMMGIWNLGKSTPPMPM